MNAEERREFVRSHRTAIFGYGRRDHGPAMTAVYYVMDGADILVSTMAARGQAKAVSRHPKVSLCVLDEKWPPTYIFVMLIRLTPHHTTGGRWLAPAGRRGPAASERPPSGCGGG